MTRIIDIVRHPRAAVIVHDFCMVVVAWFIAVWLIESTSVTDFGINLASTLTGLGIVLVLQGSVLWATGLYKGLWRFASFPDMWNIARASIFGTVAIVVVLTILQGSLISHWMPAVLIYPVLPFYYPVPICVTPNLAKLFLGHHILFPSCLFCLFLC